MISKVPQASAARQNSYNYGQNGQSGKLHFFSNVTIHLKYFLFSDYNYDYSSLVDDYLAPVLDSHALNSLIDKSFAKYLGGVLVVNLLTVATITLLVWMFVICALKPGCLVHNWRQVGASSRHFRHLSEL